MRKVNKIICSNDFYVLTSDIDIIRAGENFNLYLKDKIEDIKYYCISKLELKNGKAYDYFLVPNGKEIVIYLNVNNGFDTIKNFFESIDAGTILVNYENNTISNIDSNGNVIFNNDALDDIYDYEKNIFSIAQEFFYGFTSHLTEMIGGMTTDGYIFERQIDGKNKFFCIEIINKDDKTISFFYRSIEAFTNERATLIDRASKDLLTNIFNKNAILDYIDNIIKSKIKGNFLVGILDVDYFKNVNDAYGHLFGDKVLQTVAYLLQLVLGEDAKLGRFGGDEFVFVLPIEETDEMSIKQIARRISHRLKEYRFDEFDNFHLSQTFGLAVYPKDGKTLQDIMICADKALYRGKIKGRDCYIIYNEKAHGNINPNQVEKRPSAPIDGPVQNLSISSFMSRILDKLLKSYNLKKTISNVVDDIGMFFNLDRVVIAKENLEILFEYKSKDEYKLNRFYEYSLDEDYDDMFSSDSIFFCNDTHTGLNMNNPIYSEIYNKGVKSFVQIKLTNNNEPFGISSFESLQVRRVWKSDEIMYFNIVSKVLNAFIHKYIAEESIEQLTYNDPVTGGFNLNRFNKEVYDLKLCNGITQIVNFDIRKFRYYNEKFGITRGDKLLKQIHNTLLHLVNENERFCRINNDNFIVLLKRNNNEEVREWYYNFINEIKNTQNSNSIINIELWAGCYCNQNINLSKGVANASEAKKYAKEGLIGDLLFYDNEIEKLNLRKKLIENRMHFALSHKEFMVYFQPCFDISKNEVSSMEALVRWNLNGEIVSPDKFIPIFERNGFINELDFYVYEESISYISKWLKMGYIVPVISLNVSRNHIKDGDFLKKINNLLTKYDVDRKYIGLELTESLFIENEKLMLCFVEELSKQGFRIYMDDFGVAYSTLNFLSKMHVDVIKLDKAFIDNNFKNEKENIIIKHIIYMSKELGIYVLGEGIETEHQLIGLKSLGCDFAQGYYFAKPVSSNIIEEKYLKKIN